MGMLAIHLILYTTKEYYGVTRGNIIICNNKGTLYTFEKKSKQIPAGAKNNNVQRVLRQVESKMKRIHLLLHHVKAYQDDNTKRLDLSLEAQLNCYYKERAKLAVIDGIMDGVETRQTLPI